MSAGTIVETILDPMTNCLTPETARETLEYRVDPETQERADKLAKLAQSGTITDDQRILGTGGGIR